MSESWTSTIIKLLALLAGAVTVGLLYDQLFVVLALTAIGALVWQLYNVFRLDHWLRVGGADGLPEGSGAWPGIYAKIQYLRTRGNRHKRLHRRLMKELRQSTNALPDGGVLLNSELEILYLNRAARGLLGLRRKRDRGQRIHNLVRHPDFVEYLESQRYERSVQIPSPARKDGWLACRLVPYGRGQKLLLVRDITRQQLVEVMRRDFVANASHELRSPLTVITGYLDGLAEDESTPPDWRSPIEEMQRQSVRMHNIVEDLLCLSRLESSSKASGDNAVDVAALLHQVKKEVAAMKRERRDVTVSVDSSARVLGEQSELRSVVSNLVSNAVQFTDTKGSIELEWSTDANGGYLVVKDDGIGIAPEHIPRLTERFYRVDPGRARTAGGTGLGLAIVKHALQRHDADLEIHSLPGEGSRFACHFPAGRILDADKR